MSRQKGTIMIKIDISITSNDGTYTEQELRILKAASAEPALTRPAKTSSAPAVEVASAGGSGNSTKPAASKPEPTPKPAAKPKPAASHPEDDGTDQSAPIDPEDAHEQDGVATLDDVVARATELVAAGKTAQVKAALAEAGAKRVSELKGKSIGMFLAAL
jgi:hypothetical protein